MTLWDRILQGVTAFSVENIASAVASLVAAKLIFHYLPPTEYGVLALFLSFYATGRSLLNVGLGGLFVAEIARARGAGQRSWARFLAKCYAVLLLSTSSALLLCFIGFGLKTGNLAMWGIMGSYLWLSGPTATAHGLFHGTTRYRRLAGQTIVRSVSRVGLLISLPWWWSGSMLTGIALTYPLMEFATALTSLCMTRASWLDLTGGAGTSHSVRDLRILLTQQGLYAALIKPVKQIADQLPLWFLKATVGDAAVGAYAAAAKAYSLVFPFFFSLETTLFPLVSEQLKTGTDRLRLALRQAQKYSFWLALLVLLLGTIASRWVIGFVAGQQYTQAIPLLQLYLWNVVVYAFAQSQRPILYAVGEQRWLLAREMLRLLLASVLLAVGIRAIGTPGAVCAVILANCGSAVAGYALIRSLAPSLRVGPLEVLRIDEFDRRLWDRLTKRRRP